MIRLSISLTLLLMSLCCSAQTYIEQLSRGVVALPASKGVFVSWRLLATDDKNTSFNLLRDGELVAKDLKTVTNFTDTLGTMSSSYSVQTVVNGSIEETSDEVKPWDKPYLSVPLIRPSDDVTPDGRSYTYTPNDCSAADVDGDGDYEIILKWDPSNSHDNSHNGYSGNVYIDCYKKEGVLLWRLDLGKNIRAGAHYTQFLVYDFDGDGKAELICKTAPGTKDGMGNYITEAADDADIKAADNNADYRGDDGHVLKGPEYLTVFSCKNGKAIHTIYYNPNRAFSVGGAPEYDTEGWGDNHHGNRGERYLACAAFLGGKNVNPSAVMCRGYYTKAYLWAVDFEGMKLKTRWLHESISRDEYRVGDYTATGGSAFGQGAHSIAVADVDGDGCDEIMFGSAAIDHDGKLLYSTGLGHGDAQHLGDLNPDRPGLEYYMVLEGGKHGSHLRDAKTGEILFRNYDNNDTGRGISADIDATHRGSEFWCSAERKVYSVEGNVIAETELWLPQNFRIYWDGDLQDELIGNGGFGLRPGGNPREGNRGQRAFGQGRGQRPEGMQGREGMQRPGGMQGREGMQRPEGMQGREGMRRLQRYYVAKWNGKGVDPIFEFSEHGNSASCNGTKATPCLQADLFGDWREEIVLYDAGDKSHLNIFSTTIPTQYRVPTLMHNHTYRMGIVWQNTSYNQPPHLDYYLPDLFEK